MNRIIFILAIALSSSVVSAAPPVLGVSPTYMEFTANEGGANPEPDTLSIWRNGGDGPLNWDVIENCNWIVVEPNSGDSTGEVDDCNVIVYISSLAGGLYSCQLTVDAGTAANSPQIVDVNLTVIGPNTVYGPNIDLSSRYFEFSAIEGDANPDDQILTITNTGDGILNWQITEDCNWLMATPDIGSSTGEADDVNIVIDISGLHSGNYNCELTVSDPCAMNSPVSVDVNLVIHGPQIGLSASYFEFTAIEDGANPNDRILTITNMGIGTLNWQITEDCNWLSAEPNSGSSTGEADDVNLGVDISGLTGGTYNCQLTVSDANASYSPQIVDVNLTVSGPNIALSATYFEFTATEGGANPNDQILTVTNTGVGTLNWQITDDCNWLSAEPNSGSSTGEADDVNLSMDVDISGLTKGVYSCNLTISDTNAENSPQIVGVNLIVYDPNALLVPSEYPTIQAAIDAAVNGDTVIVADGLYKGDGNRDIDFLGKAITLRSENGPENCIIDCNASRYDGHRGFYFHNGENANSVLDGFSIINGYGSPGGGIRLENSSPTINNCVISGNKGGNGAGIGCYSWSGATISKCTISDNSSRSAGGGFYGGGNLIVTNCIIKRNAARSGGAAYGCGATKFVNCIITDNTVSDNGGGIVCWGADDNPTIINCTISGNKAWYGGGGIYCGYKSKATIINCIVWGNRAPSGPQIKLRSNSSALVSYSNIQGGWPGTDNIDADPMLALHRYYILPGSPCINAGDPVGDYSGQTDINGDPRVLGGRVDMGADEFTGEFPELVKLDIMGPEEVAEDSSAQYTAVAYYNDGFTNNVSIWADWSLEPITYGSINESGVLTTGRIPTPGDITISAQYTFIGVTGEAEMTVRVSLPIDLEIIGPEHVRENYQTQYKAVVYYANGQTSDVTDLALWQAGPHTIATIDANGLLQTEPLDEEQDITISAQYTCSGITVEADMAVEVLLPPCTWLVPADHRTIQGAIDYCIGGDEVVVADGTYTGEGNRDITFRGKAITVRSENGPENCIIDGNNEYVRGFWFQGGEDANSVLDGFTITNGRGGIFCSSNPTINNCIITGNLYPEGSGICIYGGPTITNCIISGNTTGRRGYGGGGISCGYGYGSNPIIIDCIISGNEAGSYGGGVFCWEGGNPTLINCTISGNRTTWRDGGGIYCQRNGRATLINCTISGNIAERSGGGIYCRRDSTPTLTNCIIAGNTAKGSGGGIYFQESDGLLRMTNCTLAANYAENNGGGIFCGDDSMFRLANCILWGNEDDSGTGQLSQIQGGRPEVIYSCIQDDDANDMDIPFSDANGNIDDRPMFVREPDDGGDGWWDDPCTPGVDEGANNDLGDVHLRIVSPCIDSGVPNFITGPNTVDMDGQPRVMGLDIDMGADEYEKFIIVTTPVGGEVWAGGSTHEIEWLSYGAGQVDILLSKNAGGNWQSIKSGVSDTGSYSWRILNKYCSEEAQVKVVPSEPDANVICIASGVFEIVPYDGPASVPRRKKEPRYRPVEQYGPEFGCVKWKFETDGPVTAGVTIGREIDRQRKVYAACEDGKLYALDLETGSLLWSYDVNSALVGSAAEGLQGSVYVGGRDGRLYAIDKEGGLLWTHSTDAPIYSSAVVSPQEQIYVCSEDGMLYALKRNGSEVWRYETSGFAALDGSIFATLQIGSDGTVYIAGLYDPNLYALNPKDGSVKWRCNFAPPHDPCAPSSVGRRSGWPFAPPAIAPDGTIYQTLLYDPNLYAVEPETGTVIWSTDLAGTLMWYKNFIEYPWWYTKEIFVWYGSGDPPDYVEGHELYLIGRHKHAPSWASPALGPDGTIYVSFDDPYLRAVDPDGNVKWATRLGMVGGLTVTVGDDGLVYAASTDNKLYVVEPTGEEIGRFEGDGWLSHPVIAPGHTIIVSDANNTVWAITQEDCGNKPPVLDVPPDGNEP